MAKRPTARSKVSRALSASASNSRVPGNTSTSATNNNTSPSSLALANLKSDYLQAHSAFDLKISKRDKRHIKHGQLLAKVREGGIRKNSSGGGGGGGGVNVSGRSGDRRGRVRRPGKKLKTDLGELGEVLDDVEMDGGDGVSGRGRGRGGEGGEKSGVYAEDEWEWEGVSETSQHEGGDDDDDDGMGMGSRSAGLGKGRTRRRRRLGASSSSLAGEGVSGGAGVKMVMKSLKHRPGSMKRKKVLEEREMERFKRNLAELAKAECGSGSGSGNGSGGEGEGQQQHIQQRWRALRAFIGGTMQKDKAFEGAT